MPSYLITIRGDTLEALDTAGASVDTQALGLTPLQASFVRFGAPGTEAMYIAVSNDTLADPTFWKFTNAAGVFSSVSPAGIKPALIGLMPTDNRLAVFDWDSLTAYSRLHFSDAGDPETFGATNYVELTPGDGEPITALATFSTYLIAFKRTKFFVFYGNSTDQTGGAVFNYRPVTTGAGCLGSQAFAVAPEGVYFCSRDGIYLTSGDRPTRISDAIEPIFTGAVSSFFQSSALNHAQGLLVAMTYMNGRLYVAYPSGSATANDRLLVFDTRTQRWTLWNIPAAALCPFKIDDAEELVFAYASGSNHIGRHSASYTTDDGTAITSRYRMGFSDMGYPGQEKDIDSTRVWGTGSVSIAGSRDFGDLDTATTVTLGTSPDIAAGLHNKQKVGELISYEFSGTSPWTCHRYAHYLRDVAAPGERTA